MRIFKNLIKIKIVKNILCILSFILIGSSFIGCIYFALNISDDELSTHIVTYLLFISAILIINVLIIFDLIKKEMRNKKFILKKYDIIVGKNFKIYNKKYGVELRKRPKRKVITVKKFKNI